MSNSIDTKIVEMKFDNAEFERNAGVTMQTLKSLKKDLEFTESGKSIEALSKKIDSFDMSSMEEAASRVANAFTLTGRIANKAIDEISTNIYNVGKNALKSLTVTPLKDGWGEYNKIVESTQVILSNTRDEMKEAGRTETEQLKIVTDALDELNRYADKTIYNFGDMTDNIGKFTAAGVDLEDSVAAIKGVSSLGALTGSTSQQVSSAMFQISQAFQQGNMMLRDWYSVTNASLGGEILRDSLIRTAKAQAKVNGGNKDLLKTLSDLERGKVSFNDTLKDKWITTDVMSEAFGQFSVDFKEMARKYNFYLASGAEDIEAAKREYKNQLLAKGYSLEDTIKIIENAELALKASTEVRTVSKLLETIQEALGSSWAQTFRLIVGDYLQAVDFFTKVKDQLDLVINASGEARNEFIRQWADKGGRDLLVGGLFSSFEGIYQIIHGITVGLSSLIPKPTVDDVYNFTKKFKEMSDSFAAFSKNSTVVTGLNQIGTAIGSVVRMLLNVKLGGMIMPIRLIFDYVMGIFKPFQTGKFAENIVSSLGRIGSVISWLSDQFNNFLTFLSPVAGFLGSLTTNAFGFFVNAIASLTKIDTSGIQSFFGSIGKFFESIKNSNIGKTAIRIYNAFDELVNSLGSINGDTFAAYWGNIGRAFTKFGKKLSIIFKYEIKKYFTDAWKSISGWWSNLWASAPALFESFKASLINSWTNTIHPAIVQNWEAFNSWFVTSYETSKAFLSAKWTEFSAWFSSAWEYVWSGQASAAISNWFVKNVSDPISTFFSNTFPNAWSIVSSSVSAWTSKTWTDIKDAFWTNIASPVSEYWTNTIVPTWEGQIKPAISTFFSNSLPQFFTDAKGKILKKFPIIDKIGLEMRAAWRNLIHGEYDTAGTFAQTAFGHIGDLLGQIWDYNKADFPWLQSLEDFVNSTKNNVLTLATNLSSWYQNTAKPAVMKFYEDTKTSILKATTDFSNWYQNTAKPAATEFFTKTVPQFFSDVKGKVINKFPIIERIGQEFQAAWGWLMDGNYENAQLFASNAFKDIGTLFGQVWVYAKEKAPWLQNVEDFISSSKTKISQIYGNFIGWITETAYPMTTEFFTKTVPTFFTDARIKTLEMFPILNDIGQNFGTAWRAMMAGDFTLAQIIAEQTFGDIGTLFTQIWDHVKEKIPILQKVEDFIGGIISDVQTAVGNARNWIEGTLKPNVIKFFSETVPTFFETKKNAIVKEFPIINTIDTQFRAAWNNLLNGNFDAAEVFARDAFRNLGKFFGQVWDYGKSKIPWLQNVEDFVVNTKNNIMSIASDFGGWMTDVAAPAISGFFTDTVPSFFSDVKMKVVTKFPILDTIGKNFGIAWRRMLAGDFENVKYVTGLIFKDMGTLLGQVWDYAKLKIPFFENIETIVLYLKEKLIEIASNFSSWVSGAHDYLIDKWPWIMKLEEFLTNIYNTVCEKFPGIVEQIRDGVKWIFEMLSGTLASFGIGGVAYAEGSDGKFRKAIDRYQEAYEGVLDESFSATDKVKTNVDEIVTEIKSTEEIVGTSIYDLPPNETSKDKDVGKNVAEWFSGLFGENGTVTNILKYFEENGSTVFKMFAGYKVIRMLSGLVKGTKWMGKGFKAFGKSIGGTTFEDAIGAFVKNLPKNRELTLKYKNPKTKWQRIAEGIRDIGIGIGLVVASVVVLGKIPIEEFKSAMGRLFLILAEIGTIAFVVGKLNGDNSIVEIGKDSAGGKGKGKGGGLKGLAGALLSIAGSLAVLTFIPWNTYLESLGKLGLMLLELAGFSRIYKTIGGDSKTIMNVGIVVVMLAGAVTALTFLDTQKAWIAIGQIGAIMLELGLVSRLIDNTKMGGFVGLGIAVAIITGAVRTLGTMDPTDLMTGLLAINSVILSLGITSRLASKLNFESSISSLILMFGVVFALFESAKALANYDINIRDIRDLGSTLGTTMLELGIAFSFIGLTGKLVNPIVMIKGVVGVIAALDIAALNLALLGGVADLLEQNGYDVLDKLNKGIEIIKRVGAAIGSFFYGLFNPLEVAKESTSNTDTGIATETAEKAVSGITAAISTISNMLSGIGPALSSISGSGGMYSLSYVQRFTSILSQLADTALTQSIASFVSTIGGNGSDTPAEQFKASVQALAEGINTWSAETRGVTYNSVAFSLLREFETLIPDKNSSLGFNDFVTGIKTLSENVVSIINSVNNIDNSDFNLAKTKSGLIKDFLMPLAEVSNALEFGQYDRDLADGDVFFGKLGTFVGQLPGVMLNVAEFVRLVNNKENKITLGTIANVYMLRALLRPLLNFQSDTQNVGGISQFIDGVKSLYAFELDAILFARNIPKFINAMSSVELDQTKIDLAAINVGKIAPMLESLADVQDKLQPTGGTEQAKNGVKSIVAFAEEIGRNKSVFDGETSTFVNDINRFITSMDGIDITDKTVENVSSMNAIILELAEVEKALDPHGGVMNMLIFGDNNLSDFGQVVSSYAMNMSKAITAINEMPSFLKVGNMVAAKDAGESIGMVSDADMDNMDEFREFTGKLSSIIAVFDGFYMQLTDSTVDWNVLSALTQQLADGATDLSETSKQLSSAIQEIPDLRKVGKNTSFKDKKKMFFDIIHELITEGTRITKDGDMTRLTGLAAGIKAIGEGFGVLNAAIANFDTMGVSINGLSKFDIGMQAIKDLIDYQDKASGIAYMFGDDPNGAISGTFVTNMNAIGTGIAQYVNALSGIAIENGDANPFDALGMNVLTEFNTFIETLGQTGGVWDNIVSFFGSPDAGTIQSLSVMMGDMGSAFVAFKEGVDTLTGSGSQDSYLKIAIETLISWGSSIITAIGSDTSMWSQLSLFFNDTSSETLTSIIRSLYDMGQSLTSYGTAMNTVSFDSLPSSIEPLKTFIQKFSELDAVIKETTWDENTTGKMGLELSSLGNTVSVFVTSISGDLSTATSLINSLGTLLSSINGIANTSMQDIYSINNKVREAILSLDFSGLLSAVGQVASQYANTEGINISTSLANGVSSSGNLIANAIQSVVNIAIRQANSNYQTFNTIGRNFSVGLSNGIGSPSVFRGVVSSAATVAKSAASIITRLWKEHSPSKLTQQYGAYFTEGLAIGISDNKRLVETSTTNVANSAIDNMVMALNSIDELTSRADMAPTITPVVDMSNVYSAGQYINSKMIQSDAVRAVTSHEYATSMKVETEGSLSMSAALKTEMQSIRGQLGVLSQELTNMQIVLDTGALVGHTTKEYDKELGTLAGRKRRAN